MEERQLADSESESTICDEIRLYLQDGAYPDGAEKPVIRKRSKKFEVDDGCLMYKDTRGGKNILRQVS